MKLIKRDNGDGVHDGYGVEVGSHWRRRGGGLGILFLLSLLMVFVFSSKAIKAGIAEPPPTDQTVVRLPVIAQGYMDPSGIYSADWPTIRHDAARTGYNGGENALYPPLKRIWTAGIGGFYSLNYVTAAGEDVAVTGLDAPYKPYKRNKVIMLDAKNGDERWARPLPEGRGAMLTAATFDADNVYVSGQMATHLFALERETGEISWAKADFHNFFYSQMAVVNELLYVPDRAAGVITLKTDNGHFAWADGFSGYANLGPVTWRNGYVYGWRDKSELVALDGRDGSLLWSYWPVPSLGAIYYPMIIAGMEQLFVQTDKAEFTVLNPYDGRFLYRKSFADEGYFWPIVLLDNRLIGARSDTAGENISAFDAADGSIIWRYELPEGEMVHRLIGANGVLYLLTYDLLSALDAESGKLIWSERLPINERPGDMVIANGTLYMSFEEEDDIYGAGIAAYRSVDGASR